MRFTRAWCWASEIVASRLENADRLEGYVTDVVYPGRFHAESMPLWLHAVATATGFIAPDLARAYRACELGCGDGLNLLIAAASNPLGHFVGVDFNARHIEIAKALAIEAGLRNIEFVEADFRSLKRDERFDFVITHGVWSWVAPDVQQAMLAAIDTLLAPTGLLYLGYMSQPGATVLAPLQRLMREIASPLQGDSVQKASQALGFVVRMAEAGVGYFAENPGARRQLDAMRREHPASLAHEFLSEHWRPQHVAGVMAELARFDLHYIGSATGIENIDALSLPGNSQRLVQGLPLPAAETVRDMARNQSLRRDIYQRAPRALNAEQHLAAMDTLRFALLPGAPKAGGLRLQTRIGPIEGPAELFDPVLRALQSGPLSFNELRSLPPFRNAPAMLNQVLLVLMDARCVHPLRRDETRAGDPLPLEQRLTVRGTALQVMTELGTAITRRAGL